MSRKKCQKTNISFGGRLRLFRESMGLGVKPFSKLIGISHASLSQTENNKTTTSAQTISNLVQNTNINIYWLCTGEGEMIREDEKGSLYNRVEDENAEIAEIVGMTEKVLKSNTSYSRYLAMGVRSFHHAIRTEREFLELKSKIDNIEQIVDSRVGALEENQRSSEDIRKEDPPERKLEFLKRRAM